MFYLDILAFHALQHETSLFFKVLYFTFLSMHFAASSAAPFLFLCLSVSTRLLFVCFVVLCFVLFLTLPHLLIWLLSFRKCISFCCLSWLSCWAEKHLSPVTMTRTGWVLWLGTRTDPGTDSEMWVALWQNILPSIMISLIEHKCVCVSVCVCVYLC